MALLANVLQNVCARHAPPSPRVLHQPRPLRAHPERQCVGSTVCAASARGVAPPPSAEATAWREGVAAALEAAVFASPPPLPFTDDTLLVRRGGGLEMRDAADGAPRELLFPLDDEAWAALRAASRPAPFGRGADTLVDPTVRHCWEVDPCRVAVAVSVLQTGDLSSRRVYHLWQRALGAAAARAASDLGVAASSVRVVPHKLLLYEAGCFFKPHRDTVTAADHFATLVVQLPVAGGHGGGALVMTSPDGATQLARDAGGFEAAGRAAAAAAAAAARSEEEADATRLLRLGRPRRLWHRAIVQRGGGGPALLQRLQRPGVVRVVSGGAGRAAGCRFVARAAVGGFPHRHAA